MHLTTVINQVISLFLIILIGVYARKRHFITEEINKGLTNILINITVPFMVISSFNIHFGSDMTSNVMKAFIYSFVVFALTIIGTYLFLSPLKNNRKTVLQFGNVFSNCGFIGFPVVHSVYGAEGVVYASIFNMFYVLFLWTYGTLLFSNNFSKDELKKVWVNPGMVGVYIGLPIMFLNITLHPILNNCIQIVGSMTTPLSMLIIGALLANVKIKDIFSDWSIYYGTFLKLIGIPMLIVGLSYLINDHSKVINTLIVIQAMPAAAMTSIFATRYDKHQDYAATFVFVSTLLFIVTFPLILKVIS